MQSIFLNLVSVCVLFFLLFLVILKYVVCLFFQEMEVMDT